MALVPCPSNCGYEVDEKANIPDCPQCHCPFNAEEWKRIAAHKDVEAQEAEIEEREAEAKAKKAQKEGRSVISVASASQKRPDKTRG